MRKTETKRKICIWELDKQVAGTVHMWVACVMKLDVFCAAGAANCWSSNGSPFY